MKIASQFHGLLQFIKLVYFSLSGSFHWTVTVHAENLHGIHVLRWQRHIYC